MRWWVEDRSFGRSSFFVAGACGTARTAQSALTKGQPIGRDTLIKSFWGAFFQKGAIAPLLKRQFQPG